ncbi:hypothetical protein Tco_0519398 [Tanacetum coccineum]
MLPLPLPNFRRVPPPAPENFSGEFSGRVQKCSSSTDLPDLLVHAPLVTTTEATTIASITTTLVVSTPSHHHYHCCGSSHQPPKPPTSSQPPPYTTRTITNAPTTTATPPSRVRVVSQPSKGCVGFLSHPPGCICFVKNTHKGALD